MVKNAFKKLGIIAFAVVMFSGVGVYIKHDLAQAYVRYGPAAQLNVGDITSAMIKDNTIVSADVASFNSYLISSTTIANLTATSTVSLPSGVITSANIIDGVIVNADISASAAVSVQKIATTSTTYFVTDFAQTMDGVKTFGSIPVLPASNPTTDNQAARKAYVDSATGIFNYTATAGADIASGVAVAVATSTIAAVNAESASATTEGICFGKSTLCNEAAQSFKENGMYLTRVQVSLNKSGTPTDNLVIKICGSSGADPSCANEVASTTISGASLSTSYATSTWDIYPGVLLGQGVKYWLFFDRSGANDDSNFYNVERDNAANNYANGAAAYYGSGAWTHQATWDVKFKMSDSGITQGYLYTGNSSAWAPANSIIGISSAAYATSSQAKIITQGVSAGYSGLTPLNSYYAGNYAGVIQSTAGAESYVIGKAIGTTTLFIKPAGL